MKGQIQNRALFLNTEQYIGLKLGVSVLFVNSDQNVGRNSCETPSTDSALNAVTIALKRMSKATLQTP